MSELFECVLFTASLSKVRTPPPAPSSAFGVASRRCRGPQYADPVTDLLDVHRACGFRLFREHCVFHRGSYVKDLSRLGRDVNQTVIVDNSLASYLFHPDNAVPVKSWFDDRADTELLDLIPFFENLAKVPDISQVFR